MASRIDGDRSGFGRRTDANDRERTTDGRQQRVISENRQSIRGTISLNAECIVIGDAEAVIHHGVGEGIIRHLPLDQPVKYATWIIGEAPISIHHYRRAHGAVFGEGNHPNRIIGSDAVHIGIAIID